MGMVQQLVALVRTEHSPFHEHVLGALCRCAGRQGTAREGIRVRVRWGTRGLAQEEVRDRVRWGARGLARCGVEGEGQMGCQGTSREGVRVRVR